MKCNRCDKEIDELEIFCDECKKELRRVSSRTDVNELEVMIENQKKLTDLENTKELENLDKLVEEKLSEDESNVGEKKSIDVKDFILDEDKNSKKNNKTLIIIISVVIGLVLISLVLVMLFKKDKPKEEKKEVIDYELILKKYGDKIVEEVKNYLNENEDIPSWQLILENINDQDYEIICEIHNIYTDGSIYLSGCKVNDKEITYTYGKEIIEEKEGKKISVYRKDYEGYMKYSQESFENAELAGTVTCKTDECNYVNAYDKYVLIIEENEYYLYDYTNDSINFGPFTLKEEHNVLENNSNLYGILYSDGDKNNIYNVKTGKIFKDIKGELLLSDMNFDPSIMYKYNYVVLNENGKNNFVNLKTGNVSYKIEDNIGFFIEHNNIVYITTYKNNYDKFKIYNSNGKSLFEGKEYSKFIIGSNTFLVANDNTFKVYDKDLKLKVSSKKYDKIIGLYEDFVVASNKNDLILLNTEDKLLTTFENGWDNDNYIFYEDLSGLFVKEETEKISLIVENKKIPSGIEGNCIEYYYIPSTKESGFIEKNSIY